jgi:hypothetical protein
MPGSSADQALKTFMHQVDTRLKQPNPANPKGAK